MKLTVIGCSGSYAGSYGPASCYLIEDDGHSIVFDMGNGALGPLMEHLDIYAIDAVLLSHLHLDHIADLGGLYVARKYRPGGEPPHMPIFGPASTADRLNRMYAPSDEDDDLGDSFEFHEFVPDVMKIGPFSVTVTPATHPVDAFSIRVDAGGKSLTFTGDTGPSQGLIDLARGSGLLLAEASFLEGGKNPPNLHLTAREAVAHGVQAGVDDIVLTHFVPWNDLNDTVTEAQAARDEFGFDGDLQLAHSGLVVEL